MKVILLQFYCLGFRLGLQWCEAGRICCCVQALLGLWLKNIACAYWQHYQRLHCKGPRPKGNAVRAVMFGQSKGSDSMKVS